MPRRTKILATLGPGSSHDEGIRELIVAGVNVFRLNFSHGSAEEHTQRAQTIRSISQALKTPVGILCDMQGPKIRIGSFTDDKKSRSRRRGLIYPGQRDGPGNGR